MKGFDFYIIFSAAFILGFVIWYFFFYQAKRKAIESEDHPLEDLPKTINDYSPPSRLEEFTADLNRPVCNLMLKKDKSYIVASDWGNIPELHVLHCINITDKCYLLKWNDFEKAFWVGINQFQNRFKYKELELIEELPS